MTLIAIVRIKAACLELAGATPTATETLRTGDALPDLEAATATFNASETLRWYPFLRTVTAVLTPTLMPVKLFAVHEKDAGEIPRPADTFTLRCSPFTRLTVGVTPSETESGSVLRLQA